MLFILSGCSINKFIPDNQVLLKKARVKNCPTRYVDNLKLLMKQRPRNRGIFYSEPYLWVYFKLDKGRQTNFRKALKSGFGEKPVFYDSVLTAQTVRQFNEFLINKGYLDASVKQNLKVRDKKAKLSYLITLNKPFRINSVNYIFFDNRIKSMIYPPVKPYIQTGMIFNSDFIMKERERIAHELNNAGYYKFSKNYIYFDVDTTLARKNLLDVIVIVKNVSDTSFHKIYKISKVYIDPAYIMNDTIIREPFEFNEMTFLRPAKKLNLKVLTNRISIKKESLYRIDDVRKTINELSDLQIYKFIDINFEEIPSANPDTAWLYCTIRLTPEKKQGLTDELELNTTEENKQLTLTSNRYYGMAGSLTYRNRNIFKNAIQWSTTLGGALDIESTSFKNRKLKGNYELELNTSLLFPTAFLPHIMTTAKISQSSKTALNGSYFYESNLDFKRNTLNFSYVYQFLNNLNRHFISPIEISLVKTQLDPDFKAQLESINDPFLSNAFETHLLANLRYLLIYNNKGVKESKYKRIRFSVETAGNVFRLVNKIAGEHNDTLNDRNLTIGGINYFQYFKTDLDVSFNFNTTPWSSVAYRIYGGIGVPYGNSNILPFEKRYYSGGVNSIRAWPIRELGPGSYKDTSAYRFDRSGELKFETNLEYRFDIFYYPYGNIYTKGALFLDAGNIWNLKKDTIRRGGDFQFSEFIPELALGGGFGLRFDFTYFILRFDLGFRMHDPEKDKNERWVILNFGQDKWLKNNTRINIGIGYPF